MTDLFRESPISPGQLGFVVMGVYFALLIGFIPSALARYRYSAEQDQMWDDLHRDLDAADTRLRLQKAEARAYGEGN